VSIYFLVVNPILTFCLLISVPRTAALVKLATKQQKERKPPAEREGLWLPTETALYIRTVTARVEASTHKADQDSVKRKRLDGEDSSARPSKKRKGGTG
jgi:hypothetical protein